MWGRWRSEVCSGANSLFLKDFARIANRLGAFSHSSLKIDRLVLLATALCTTLCMSLKHSQKKEFCLHYLQETTSPRRVILTATHTVIMIIDRHLYLGNVCWLCESLQDYV